MLCLGTGKGKTYCLIHYLSLVKKLAMVIVDQDHIIEQWFREIMTHTDLNEEDVYFISGSDSIKTLMEYEGELPFKMYIASHRTLAIYSKDDPSLIDQLMRRLKIGIKVFDEAHVEWKNICHLDFNSNVSETIYLTATPSRSNPSEDKVFQNIFFNVPKFGLETKYDENELYHKVIYVQYNTHPTAEPVS